MDVTPQNSAVAAPVVEPPNRPAPALDALPADETPRHSRLKASGPHGRPVQVAYAVIDCAMVGLVGALVFYSQSVIALEPPALGTYVPVIFAYAVLVVLSCTSQDLYRTPRDRGAFEETLMVLKAVSLATAVLVLFGFAFGAQ